MELLNFSLQSTPTTVTLVEGGREWELHNYAVLQSAQYSPLDNIVTLTWGLGDFPVPAGVNPWGGLGNRARGCKISFEGVRYFEIASGEAAGGADDNATLSYMAHVSLPSSDARIPADLRIKRDWKEGEPHNLLFEFQSGRRIEVGAERARFASIE